MPPMMESFASSRGGQLRCPKPIRSRRAANGPIQSKNRDRCLRRLFRLVDRLKLMDAAIHGQCDEQLPLANNVAGGHVQITQQEGRWGVRRTVTGIDSCQIQIKSVGRVLEGAGSLAQGVSIVTVPSSLKRSGSPHRPRDPRWCQSNSGTAPTPRSHQSVRDRTPASRRHSG